MKHAWPAAVALALTGLVVGGCGGTTGATSDAPAAGAIGAGAAGAGGAASGGRGGSDAGAPFAGGGSGAAGSPSNSVGGSDGSCALADVEELAVFSSGRWDALGYPPYALDGCTLVYVAPTTGGGALRRRDLVTGDDQELEAAALEPRRPALAGDVIAWEIGEGSKSQVRVSYRGRVRTLAGDFDHAGEPRAAADAVAFTGFMGPSPTDDANVYLYEVARDAVSAVAAGPGQQRFADVSLTHVAATDFSEDVRGYFDESASVADVLIIDRESGRATPRKRAGKQAFPLLGSDGGLVYLDWGEVHPEPKFSRFGLRAGALDAPLDADYDVAPGGIHTDPSYLRPSLRGTQVDFVDTRNDAIGLYRFTLGSALPPVSVPVAGSQRLLGPVATDTMTLIARVRADQTWALTAVSR